MTESATGLVLHSPEGVAYRFDPGALCLELLPTGGPGAFARYEVLHEPADLARWASQCRLHLAADEVEVTGQELAAARRLRDCLWRLASGHAHGLPLRDADLTAVNAAADRAPLVPALSTDGRRAWRRPVTGTQLLSAVARDAIELFSGPYADRVRECGAHDCHLLFVDTSRPGRRRWCSMERCGNRSKVRAHRERREGHGGYEA